MSNIEAFYIKWGMTILASFYIFSSFIFVFILFTTQPNGKIYELSSFQSLLDFEAMHIALYAC